VSPEGSQRLANDFDEHAHGKFAGFRMRQTALVGICLTCL
jgi:hypothetical protein